MQILLDIITLTVGIFFAWLFTHLYYKKSLKNQEEEATKQIDECLNLKLVDNQLNNSAELLRLEYIKQAVAEHKRAGTPVRVIDTFNIPDSEKADIYDAVMMRVKGRFGKSNKYRNKS